ncbi:hypothetical protein [Micrococcoides hystricis]|uniref:DUF2550 family protein n=1 Tax=Micrococcoides hystricis TaxID=1572761 RepID=A0ABV6PA68_9MICC
MSPEWVTALATVAMLIIAIAAAWYARSQWQESQSMRKHAQDEAARLRAAGLNAWWLSIEETPGSKKWGVVVDNSSNAAFYDLELQCRSKQDSRHLRMRIAPPGTYFIESTYQQSNDGWGYPEYLPQSSVRQSPILNARDRNFMIESLIFTDSAAVRWEVTPEEGLKKLS